MQELFVPGIMLMILIGIAFVTGRLAEAAHERALRRDEQLLPNQHLSTEDHVPEDIVLRYSRMVTGKVVIGEDRFRNLLARLRIFVGGRLGAHEATITRAKREAMLRMRTDAKGASHITGIRMTTAQLGRGMVEMMVSGTALYTDKRPSGGFPSALPDDGINISHKNLLVEFTSASAAFLFICWGIYAASGFAVEWATRQISIEDEIAIWSDLEGDYITERRSDDQRSLPERYILDLINSIPKSALGPAAAYDFEVVIIPDDTPNAAALPGGLILVHTGMLELVDTETNCYPSLVMKSAIIMAVIIFEGLGRQAVGVALSAMMFQADAVLTTWIAGWPKMLADLDYSRSQELDADKWGLDIVMAKYGHATDVATTFAKLAMMQEDKSMLDYLGTHPHPMDRVRRLNKMVADRNLPLGEPIPLQKAFERYVDALEGQSTIYDEYEAPEGSE